MSRHIPLLAFAVLSTTHALAYEHTGVVVAEEDRPLQVSVEVDPQVAGLSPGQVRAEIEAGLTLWSEPLCGFDAEFLGEVAYEDPTNAPDTHLHLVFESLGSGGPFAFRLGATPDPEPAFERDGIVYRRARPGAWVINTDYRWTTTQAIEDGACSGAYSLSGIVAFLVGYNSGLAPQVQSGSVMSAQPRMCQVPGPSADDLAGMDALYGPWIGIACTAPDVEPGQQEIPGVVPFDITCHVVADGETVVTEASWSFGDGGDADGGLSGDDPVVHTYTVDDNYTLRVNAAAEHPVCPPITRRVERINYIRACDTPRPAMRLERESGLRFRLVNQSDVRTYGCHDDVRWAIYTEDGAPVLEETSWEPLVELPEDGVYRVELTLSGLAGEATVDELLDTKKGGVRGYNVGTGCSSVGLASGAALPLLGLLLLARRRRR